MTKVSFGLLVVKEPTPAALSISPRRRKQTILDARPVFQERFAKWL